MTLPELFWLLGGMVAGALLTVLAVEGVVHFGLWLEARRERARKRELMMYLTPSEVCRKYHIQACHHCEDFNCCDNTGPMKKLLDAAKKLSETKGCVDPKLNDELERQGLPRMSGVDLWVNLADAIRECER